MKWENLKAESESPEALGLLTSALKTTINHKDRLARFYRSFKIFINEVPHL